MRFSIKTSVIHRSTGSGLSRQAAAIQLRPARRYVLDRMKDAGFGRVQEVVKSLKASYPSARRFTDLMLEGTSKATKQMLDLLAHDQREALTEKVARLLRPYGTATTLDIANESRIVVAYE